MSCSCQTTNTSTSCSCASTNNACTCATETVINPLTITPVTASAAADNKWSVQSTLKARNGNGAQTSKYAGQVTGDTTQDKVNAMHTELVGIATDLIRGVIGESYEGPALNAGVFDPTYLYNDNTDGVSGTAVAILTDLTAFQNYFLNIGDDAGNAEAANTAVTGTQNIAYVNYISQALFQVFQSIQRHIEGADTNFVVCPSGSSRVIKIEIDNCVVCFEFIYN